MQGKHFLQTNFRISAKPNIRVLARFKAHDLLQEEISCQKKKYLVARKIFMLHKIFFMPIFPHRKYFLVTGRNFFTLEVISCQRKKFLVIGRIFLSKEDIPFHRLKFLVMGKNHLSLGKISCHVKKFLVKHVPKLLLFCMPSVCLTPAVLS